MRVVTWNINSVRLRLPQLLRVMDEHAPEVICLQETKVVDDLFPLLDLHARGYHALIDGIKSYNGVAILSRLPMRDARVYPCAGRMDARHIAARIAGIDVHCLYVPAGGDIPDPQINEKFAHKLAVLDELIAWAPQTYSATDRVMICGDLNVAPHEHDVWSHRQLLDVVSHTPIEVEKLLRLQSTLGFVDTARAVIPMDQKAYSWWSYRNNDWQKSDRGRRLDHIWVTSPLAPRLRAYHVLTDLRAAPRPSDHAPVMVEIKGK